MYTTHKIKMDLLTKQNIQTIHAVHDDTNSRYIEISLFECGIPWKVPENSQIAISYLAANGASGIYDTLPNGADAYIYGENKITIILIPSALYPGTTKVTVVISDENSNQISTFPLNVEVDENYSYGASKPETYINLRQWLSKELADMVIGPTTVTITQKGDELAADKIYAELHAAHVAGQTVHCKLPDGSVLALATADENDLLFQGENGRDYQQIIIGADGTITYKRGKYALLGELVTDALIGVYPSATGDGYESTDDLADLQESYKSGRTLVCNLQIDDRGHLRLPMSKKEDSAFYFSAVFEGKEYMVTISQDDAGNTVTTVEQVEYWTDADKEEIVAAVLAALTVAEEVAF